MASITIARSNSFAYRAVPFDVLVDGSSRGQVDNGSAIRIVVGAGRHQLYLAYGAERSDSLEVDLLDGEQVEVKVRPRFSGPKLFLFPFFIFQKGNLLINSSHRSVKVVHVERGLDFTVLTLLVPRGRVLLLNMLIATAAAVVLFWLARGN